MPKIGEDFTKYYENYKQILIKACECSGGKDFYTAMENLAKTYQKDKEEIERSMKLGI